jgi:hypothetical protein
VKSLNHFNPDIFRRTALALVATFFCQMPVFADENEDKLIALSNWAYTDYSDLFLTEYSMPQTGSGYLYTCFSNLNCIGFKDNKVDVLINNEVSTLGSVDETIAMMEAATKPVDGNCTIFPADNPWNTDISNLPVHKNSDIYITSIGLDGNVHPDFGTEWNGAPNGIPVIDVQQHTPRRKVNFIFSEESDHELYPFPNNPPIEGGPNGAGDRHIIMVDQKACKLFEIFSAWPPNSEGNESLDHWQAGSGAIFNLRSNELRGEYKTSADAAGLPIFPGLVRYSEVIEQKEINHALRFTVKKTQRAYIHPATHFASKSTDPDLPPMGLRVRLKTDFDITSFSEEAQVILRALKKYGMLLADNGGNWFISGVPDPRWNDENLAQLKNVPGSVFEAVDTGDLILPQ